jgi:immunity protein, SdpI family
MKFIQMNALSFACLAAMLAVGMFMYPGLPETLPTQYDFDGIASNYLPKEAVILILPLSYAASIAVIHFLIRFSPEKFAMQNSQRAMDIVVLSIGILLLAIHIGLLMSRGDGSIFQRYFSIGFAFFIVIMGNVIGKTERNFIIGIRLPWTLASEQNWRATHRLAGKLMVASGLILLAISFYSVSLVLTLSLGLGWLVIAAIYSFMFFLKNERTSSE